MVNSISFKGLPINTRVVSEKLIVGAKQGLRGLKQLRDEENVTMVVNMCKKRPYLFPLEKFLCKLLKIKYVHVPTSFAKFDGNLKKNFDIASNAIIAENKTGKTFVHCKDGEHRSVLVSALVEIKNGKIKSIKDLDDFIKLHHYFRIHPTWGGIKKSPEKIKRKLASLTEMKNRFIEMYLK